MSRNRIWMSVVKRVMRARMGRPSINVRWPSFLPNQSGELFGSFEPHLRRRISPHRRPGWKALLRQLTIEGPREIDPTAKRLVDRAEKLRGDAGDQASGGELRRFPDHGAAGDDGATVDHRAAVDRRVHANQAVALDRAAMDDGGVAHRDPKIGRAHV